MPSRFQFETVMKLLSAGINNYVQIRQQAGLTSDELDDILEHIPEYKKRYEEEDRLAEVEKLKSEKKLWWRRK